MRRLLCTDGGVLDMESFGITEFPSELVRLTQLFSHMVFMNFDYNNLSTLPREVGKLTNLTRLSFNRNRQIVFARILARPPACACDCAGIGAPCSLARFKALLLCAN